MLVGQNQLYSRLVCRSFSLYLYTIPYLENSASCMPGRLVDSDCEIQSMLWLEEMSNCAVESDAERHEGKGQREDPGDDGFTRLRDGDR